MPVLAEFQVGQVLWSMLWFALFFMWIWLVIHVFSDIFRSDDLSGGGKTAWTIFVIFLPYLGVFSYLLARGKSMGDRDIQQAQARDDAMRAYVREAAGTPSGVAELQRLADLRDRGAIDEAEFQAMKSKVVGTPQPVH